MVIPKKIIDHLALHLAGILDVITHDEAQPRAEPENTQLLCIRATRHYASRYTLAELRSHLLGHRRAMFLRPRRLECPSKQEPRCST